jgi:hypothetical protein
MNSISVHCVISILRRFLLINFKQIITILAKLDKTKLGSGWQRAINNSHLFLSMFQYCNCPDLTSNKVVELRVWKTIFPKYPQLSNWNNNIEIYESVIKRELHIQRVLDHLCLFDLHNNEIYGPMRFLKNPELTICELEIFLLGVPEIQVDLPRLVDDLVEIRGWPKHIDTYIKKNDFWRCVFRILSTYKPHTESQIANLYAFIEKYVDHIDWLKDDIYKFLDYNFLEAHTEIWLLINWQKIIIHIKLPEPILDTIMECANTQQPFFGKYINVAHITTYQRLTEEFIEKWFVKGLYDQEQIWACILRAQKHLSAEFFAKYVYKQSKNVKSLLEILKGI